MQNDDKKQAIEPDLEENDSDLDGADDEAEEKGDVVAGSVSGQQQDEEPDEPERPRAPRTRPTSAKQLILDHVPDRAQYANSHLRVELTGSVLVKIRDSQERFLFDWRGDKAKTEETKVDSAECTISVTENDLLRIANGDLNPQVSMLSDKVRVEGKSSLAIYFFNLVAP